MMLNKELISNKSTILYSSRTLDDFANKIIDEPLTENSFEERIQILGSDFRFNKLIETIHITYKSKSTVETLLHRKTLSDLIIRTEEEINTLRKLDNEYSKVLASGFNFMFNAALWELFFLNDSFPEKISKEVKEINRQTIRETINYVTDMSYDDKKHNFIKKNGEEIVRPIHIPFKEVYNQKNAQIAAPKNITPTERSILAIYSTFSHKYKRFKDDVALLNAAVVVEHGENKEGADNALMRLYNLKEHLSDIKPNRLSIRYYATRDIMQTFSKLKPGYDLLEDILSTHLKTQVPQVARQMAITTGEKIKSEYINIGYGKYGKRISDIIFYNGVITLGLGLINGLSHDLSLNEIPDKIHQIPVVKSLYDIFTNLYYNIFAGAMIIGVLNKIPAGMLRKEYENIKKIVYV